MNLKAPESDLATLFAEDARAARSTYPGTAIRDGVISSYSTFPALVDADLPSGPLYGVLGRGRGRASTW